LGLISISFRKQFLDIKTTTENNINIEKMQAFPKSGMSYIWISREKTIY